MKVRTVRLRGFKRFAHLTIPELPSTARLVVAAGPNGFGKSSLFEAFRLWAGLHGGHGWQNVPDYYDRAGASGTDASITRNFEHTSVIFHGHQPGSQSTRARKAFYFRSAYRNDPELMIGNLGRVGSALTENRFFRMIETDKAVTLNYQRLVSDALADAFDPEGTSRTLNEWRENIIGELRDATGRLFPQLILNGLGSPLEDANFRFTKGVMRGFSYVNLSGGEKAAFDLLLDLIVKRREYDDTVFCIDEPEAHINPRLHGPLLRELVRLIPEGCQLWLATHAIGMMRAARDMENADPGSVIFLDFDNREFDEPVTIHPTLPTRAFWAGALRVALDDLADLIAPRELIVCEGTQAGARSGKNAEHDARCYTTIFGDEMPDVAFVAGGNSHDITSDRLGIASTMPAIVKGTDVRPLIDRNDHSPDDVTEFARRGVRVLGRRNLEAYLYDDEVLRALCTKEGLPEKIDVLLEVKRDALRKSVEERRNSIDDLKPAAPEIYQGAKHLLGLTGFGNDNRAFERNVLAKLIKPGMTIYHELKNHVFATVPPREEP